MHSLQGPPNYKWSAVADGSPHLASLCSEPQAPPRGLWTMSEKTDIGTGPQNIEPQSTAISHLDEQGQLLQAMFASSNVGVGIFNSELQFEKFNDALASMNGVPGKSLRGKSVVDILGNAADQIVPIFKQVMATGKPLLNQERSFKITTRPHIGHW